MQTIYDFFYFNKTIVIFSYAFIFFLMGIGILLKNRQHSRFSLAKSLHLLALFGILHALADWGHVFIPIQQVYSSEQTYLILRVIRIIVNALSFMFIVQFGVSLWTNTKERWYKLKYLPAIMFVLWLFFIIASILYFDLKNNLDWIRISDIWSRYLMAFPGSILSGYAILLQKKEFNKFGFPKFFRALEFAGISMIVYGFSAGLVVPPGSVGLSRVINSDLFFQITGLPIEVIRGFTGLILSVSVLAILQVFDKEYINRIQEIEKDKARFEERNRLAQDLHDDIIQSLYASNLELEVVKHLIDKNPKTASEKLSLLLKKRNKIINQIREYIGELKRVNQVNLSLQKRMENLLDELDIYERLNVKIEDHYEGKQLSLTTMYHLILILKEAISNVVKHAEAQNLTIKVSNNDKCLLLVVLDDGIGFSKNLDIDNNQTGLRQGLQNMKERVKMLNGLIQIKSRKDEGTKIMVRIPLNGGLYD
ncbi:MAG: hypothetical protein APF76_12540 [Desulfitibacter sp. BRH_c19]|nr:MAG: hypothetical protein APF76_12540 [Desulfitibacter sp. BRH_c19]